MKQAINTQEKGKPLQKWIQNWKIPHLKEK